MAMACNMSVNKRVGSIEPGNWADRTVGRLRQTDHHRATGRCNSAGGQVVPKHEQPVRIGHLPGNIDLVTEQKGRGDEQFGQ